MISYNNRSQESKSESVANAIHKHGHGKSSFQYTDNRPEAFAQKMVLGALGNSSHITKAAQLQAMANSYSTQQQQPIQKKENKTGLPDSLKTGIETLSGYSMDDVKVHYNSNKPSQLQAHAYAQGNDIHLASGQEKHLPHEAWHVVQQKQGRVKPTMQLKGKVNINDDSILEREADNMGKKALSIQRNNHSKKGKHSPSLPRNSSVQRKITGFVSKSSTIDTPLHSYIKQADPNVFAPNASGHTFSQVLSSILPATVKNIEKIDSVTANITPNGPSEYLRSDHASKMVGHAGRQEALLSTGSEFYYQGGHLISHSLIGKDTHPSTAGKIDGYTNLAPMEAALNNMTYKDLESKLGSTGPGQATITVETYPGVKVLNGVVSHLTGCPLVPPADPQAFIAIPSSVARGVTVNLAGNSIGVAKEIPRAAAVEGPITTGKELLDHLAETGSMPWMDPTLVAKLQAL